MTGAGDPGSTAALGGALRGQALALVELVSDLEAAGRRAGRRGAPDVTARERDLLTTTARELDALGAALQAWTSTVAESAARLRAIAAEADLADLELVGPHVVEVPGPSRVEPGARAAARSRLQELLNRVTAAQAKDRARIAREVARSAPLLAGLSERARSGR